MSFRVTLLAGGVGGAKMAEGFAALDDVDLSIIGNIADDEAFHGLWVSPDIDTLTYSLAGLINRDQGWGVADEGRRALDVLGRLGADIWMFLGDRDFGLHIYRTERRRRGDRPSDIAQDIAKSFGLRPRILLPTDDIVQTQVKTADGWLSFQEYFVREQCRPDVEALHYAGIDKAKPSPAAIESLHSADLIVIAPSNPLVSILPILGIKGIGEAVREAKAPVIAVSPLIAGKVVKGPADRMLSALGHRADVTGLARIYADLADILVIDQRDKDLMDQLRQIGPCPICTNILMPDLPAKRRLATEILSVFASRMAQGVP